jgi:hypothetical protein
LSVWAIVAALMIVLVGPVRSWYIHHERGNPDPGGERLAVLTHVAKQAVPPTATDEQLRAIKSRWEAGGCDGGPDGWSRLEADEVFHTTDDSLAPIDAAMTRQHWRPLPSKGGTAVREYQPLEDSYEGYGWLYSSTDGHGTRWELDVSAAPAKNPSHAC